MHDDATWSDARLTRPELSSTDPAQQPLRQSVRTIILHTESAFAGHINPAGPPFRLRPHQRAMLDSWVAGDFDDTPVPAPTDFTPDGLTRAALEAAAGQGFCPGIEAGIIFLDPTLYSSPFDFRIDHSTVSAGDLTALMAQPWQADFLKCNTEWWPTQRPDLAPQADGSVRDWVRGAGSHTQLVQKSGRLGLVVQQGATEVFVEVERDPNAHSAVSPTCTRSSWSAAGPRAHVRPRAGPSRPRRAAGRTGPPLARGSGRPAARGCDGLLDDGGPAFPGQHHRPLAAFTVAWEHDGPVRRSLPFWRAQCGLVLDREALDRWLRAMLEICG